MQTLVEAHRARSKKINKIESIKDTKSIAEAMADLERYVTMGYDAISREDLAYHFKCFGLFDMSKVDGKNLFMIRVRIPGGQLDAKQAEVLGAVAVEYGRDSIDLTTRMQVELRYIAIEDVPTVLHKLDAVGLSTYQAGVDNIRNILTDPLDGVSIDNHIEAMPILSELQKSFLRVDECIGSLPRKFNTAISGSISNRCNIMGHDCCFYLAQKDGVYGFNVALGGKVAEVASRADVFLKDSAEVVLFFTHLIKVFKEYGFRDNRNKNRLFYLIEAVGMRALVLAVMDSAQYEFATAGDEISDDVPHTSSGVISQKDSKFAVRIVVPVGSFGGSAMIDVAQTSMLFGDGRIRLTYDQNLFILGVDDVDSCLGAGIFDRYKSTDTPYINALISCIGKANCQYGVIDTKSVGKELARYMDESIKLPDDAQIRLHFSGCLKGCGLNTLGDIGFQGTKTKDSDGNICEAVHITLGGKMSKETKEGRVIYKKALLVDAKRYLGRLLEMYSEHRVHGESFEEYDSRVLSSMSIDEIVEMIG